MQLSFSKVAIVALLLCATLASATNKWLAWTENEDAPFQTYYPDTHECQQWGELPPCNPWEPRENGDAPNCAMTNDGRICSLGYDEEKRNSWTCYKLTDCKNKGKKPCPCGTQPAPVCTWDMTYDPMIAHCGCVIINTSCG